MDGNTLVVVAAFIVNLIVCTVHATWALARIESALRKDIQTSRDETDGRIDRQSREFGETAAAIRQKVTEVELYIRDNFVRKPSFEAVMGRIEADLKELGKDFVARLDRMEEKIDGKV